MLWRKAVCNIDTSGLQDCAVECPSKTTSSPPTMMLSVAVLAPTSPAGEQIDLEKVKEY
jgi:hypothetical protein